MDYEKIYFDLIEHRKMMPKLHGVYYERHHILPVCMGGGDEDENLIYLTAEDHFMAHLLLAKAYGTASLWHAVRNMSNIHMSRGMRANRRLVALAMRKSREHSTIGSGTKYEWLKVETGEVFKLTRLELKDMHGVPLPQSLLLLRKKDNKVRCIRKGFALFNTDIESVPEIKPVNRKNPTVPVVEYQPSVVPLPVLDSDPNVYMFKTRQIHAIIELTYSQLAKEYNLTYDDLAKIKRKEGDFVKDVIQIV